MGYGLLKNFCHTVFNQWLVFLQGGWSDGTASWHSHHVEFMLNCCVQAISMIVVLVFAGFHVGNKYEMYTYDT